MYRDTKKKKISKCHALKVSFIVRRRACWSGIG